MTSPVAVLAVVLDGLVPNVIENKPPGVYFCTETQGPHVAHEYLICIVEQHPFTVIRCPLPEPAADVRFSAPHPARIGKPDMPDEIPARLSNVRSLV